MSETGKPWPETVRQIMAMDESSKASSMQEMIARHERRIRAGEEMAAVNPLSGKVNDLTREVASVRKDMQELVAAITADLKAARKVCGVARPDCADEIACASCPYNRMPATMTVLATQGMKAISG